MSITKTSSPLLSHLIGQARAFFEQREDHPLIRDAARVWERLRRLPNGATAAESFAEAAAQALCVGAPLFGESLRRESAFPAGASCEGATEDLQALRRLSLPLRAAARRFPELNALFAESARAALETGVFENILADHDGAQRKKRGVYYTPQPAIAYVVGSIDEMLRRDFELAEGLADDVTIFDPATGIGCFLLGVAEALLRRATENSSTRRAPRTRLYGCELLTAPWVVATLRLARLRAALRAAYPESPDVASGAIALGSALDPASLSAAATPSSSPLVILGNPPWSGHSANPGAWIDGLMRRGVSHDDAEGYFSIDGAPLRERNLKWVNDDYVKFMRFGQWRIQQAGCGILAFVTNHGYLENPTFRALRHSLMESFDALHVLDLHGNAKKREHSGDQNVFEILQGAAIGLFVRLPRTSPRTASSASRRPVVRRADLWGRRDEGEGGGKLGWLARHTAASTPWSDVIPVAPHFLFRVCDQSVLAEYQSGWGIDAVFSLGSIGVATSRDGFAVGFSAQELEQRVDDFLDPALSDDEARARHLAPRDKLSVESARAALRADPAWRRSIAPCLYRPFDRRALLYHEAVLERARRRVMRHFWAAQDAPPQNLGLIVCRGKEIGRSWEHVFCSKDIIQLHSASMKEGNYLFPLYQYEKDANGAWTGLPNFSAAFQSAVSERFSGAPPSPETTFHYIYAVLHAPSYRARYADLLKADFPRVPPPQRSTLFYVLAALGARLVELHVAGKGVDGASGAVFHGAGEAAVIEIVRFEAGPTDAENRVWINKRAFFSGVSTAAWAVHVGGYHVAARWLKDRKGRIMTLQESKTYGAVLAALAETAELMQKIDQAILAEDEWPLRNRAASPN